MSRAEQVKAAVSLRALAERAGVIWDPRRSQPRRGDYWAPCPFHAERSASFHVLEPAGVAGFFNCFGCGRKGSAIDFLIEAEGMTFRDALDRLASFAGVETEDAEGAARRIEAQTRARARADAEAESRSARGLAIAREIWTASEQAGPLLESYLAARGVDLDAIGGVPASLRFAPALAYWAPGQIPARDRPAHIGPAMIAAIGRGALVGVHRTWITATGRARLPNGSKIPKKMIGRSGSIFGAPVRLSTSRLGVVVGEGWRRGLAPPRRAGARQARGARARGRAARSRRALGHRSRFRRPRRRRGGSSCPWRIDDA